YTVDFLPHQVVELMDANPTLHAIKESSADVRRIAELRRLLGNRLRILCGEDDLIVEAVAAGAEGWIAGLVNAFPRESVDLFNYAAQGETAKAYELYLWFLPLLRLDVVRKFVQLIKRVQQEVGMGSERVRPPRMTLVGPELEDVREILRVAMATKPQ
ncbi:MAG: dihydrodipicolinate synthetase, partial [Bryobacterales bacterium]|nr:dihydrodipicolinate synthetase [Bryobacterales bacterium]